MLKIEGVNLPGKPKTSTMSAKVIYADGTIGPDRIVAFSHHQNRFLNFFGSKWAYCNGWFWEKYYTQLRKRRLKQ